MSFAGLSEIKQGINGDHDLGDVFVDTSGQFSVFGTNGSSYLTTTPTDIELSDGCNLIIDGDRYSSQEIKNMFMTLKEISIKKHPELFL